MTGDENKILLEIRDRTTRIEQRLEDRDRQCVLHAKAIAALDERIDHIERQLTGLRSWIASAGLIGGIFGWVAHTVLPTMTGR
ncbi:hypothetical protein RBH88_03325 [Aminobacterium sp. MB27-C1]|uniref:hypothetical protein n=1 Tax=Aminobacterium sp. MB27-C1 TaxID=3070661 RepID=UPI0027DBF6AC|nr:hypothetical protein [Aminobacterium sp. MB27-C1]WMI72145.1 hypothetical protein RBH88_03325 [Aminobacterium sp. MB27-C1]